MNRAEWAKKWKPYKSKLEHDFAQSMKDKGIGFEYEGEILQYRKRVVGGICDSCGTNKTSQKRKYLPDFLVRTIEGRVQNASAIYIETKGNFTPADRAKMLAVAKDNPELDIRLVFAQNNKLNKKNDKRYSDWAQQHGFLYHIGSDYPDSWSGDHSGQTKRKLGKRSKARRRRKRKADRGGSLQEVQDSTSGIRTSKPDGTS